MIFTFDEELSFNVPNFGRSFCIDVTNERMQKQKNYTIYEEAFKGKATHRESHTTTIEGEVTAEMTHGNEAWSFLTGCVLGTRISISGYKFTPNVGKSWGILIGYLNAAVTADSTTLSINEAESGDFNGVNAIIVNNEFIKGSSVSGSFTATERGSEGTTARTHGVKDLVYGITEDVNRSVVLTCRKKEGGYYVVDNSLTAVVDRGDLFAYSGLRLDGMTFNFRVFDTITAHLYFMGADSTNAIVLGDSTATDQFPIISIEDMKVYSEHVDEKLRQFYIEIHNNLNPSFTLTGGMKSLIMLRGSCYGVITWTDDSLEHILRYESNERYHMSLSTAYQDFRMIFAMNNVRINTNSFYYDGELIIQDSAPWYAFEDPVIMYQV